MRRAMRAMVLAARKFARRTAAATRLQAAARGMLARQRAARLRAAQAARRQAALAVIAPWGAAFAARARFLGLRCAPGAGRARRACSL